MANTASRAKIVQRWLADRIGLVIILVAVAVVVGLMGRINPPRLAQAQVRSNTTTTWGDICNCRVILQNGNEMGAHHDRLNNIRIATYNGTPPGPGDSVVIGFFTEQADRGQSNTLQREFEVLFNDTVVDRVNTTTNNSRPTATAEGTFGQSGEISLPYNRSAWSVFINISDVVRKYGEGNYRLHVANLANVAFFPRSYGYIIDIDASYPRMQAAVQDFSYSASTRPATWTSTFHQIVPVPEGWHYATGAGTLSSIGGTFDEDDRLTLTYQMGAASGPLNAGSLAFWTARVASSVTTASVPNLDPTATSLVITINDMAGGLDDSAGVFVFQAQLAPDAPPIPPVVVDTCYDEE